MFWPHWRKKQARSWSAQGLQVFAINVDNSNSFAAPQATASNKFLAFTSEHRFTFPVLRGSQDIAAIYNILFPSAI